MLPFKILFQNVKEDILYYLEISGKTPTIKNCLLSLFSIRLMPVFIYRYSYFFFQFKLKPISKFFSLVNYLIFGIEIAINTVIDGGLFLPHTNGTVIGAQTIGKRVIIYHNVTIGAKFIDINSDFTNRPILGDNVKIATGSIIIGNVKIGNGVTIGPNIVISSSIEPNNKVLINS